MGVGVGVGDLSEAWVELLLACLFYNTVCRIEEKLVWRVFVDALHIACASSLVSY